MPRMEPGAREGSAEPDALAGSAESNALAGSSEPSALAGSTASSARKGRAEASAVAGSAEEQLLREALGDAIEGELRVLSRQPYGSGAITGFAESGEQTRYWYVDTSGKRVAPEAGPVLGDPGRPTALIWLHPGDPRLPALASACFPESAATLMGRLGVSIDRRPELLVYRPGKRAMLRMRAGDREAYLKIVRPDTAAAIVRLQETLLEAGVPVPRITGWSERGIVLSEPAEGVALASRIGEADPERLLDAIDALRARIATVDLGRAARASLASRDDWYRARTAAALERLASEGAEVAPLAEPLAAVTAMITRADASARAVDPAALRTIHGDLHVGQLFVSSDEASRITGLIDVDTAGLGDPADDEAALMAHLVASIGLARAGAPTAAGFRRLLDAASARWLAQHRDGRARVAHRTAVHVLAHALGPLERGELDTAETQLREGLALLRDTAPVDARRGREVG